MTPTVLFVVSNLVITGFYVFVAAVVVPRSQARLWYTRLGGIGFFFLCGLHHLDNVAHVLFAADDTVAEVLLSWHMLLIDVPQGIFVGMFVIGLWMEAVRWGPWSANRASIDEVAESSRS